MRGEEGQRLGGRSLRCCREGRIRGGKGCCEVRGRRDGSGGGRSGSRDGRLVENDGKL